MTRARLAGVFLTLALAGCGESAARFKPAGTTARAALELALNAWKNGESADTLASGVPPVQAVDSHWRAGRKLASFEIVKEEPGETDQRFSVRLIEDGPGAKGKLKSAPAPAAAEVTYVVIGHDPVWVYRDEDYARLLNMDDSPKATRPAAKSKPGGRP